MLELENASEPKHLNMFPVLSSLSSHPLSPVSQGVIEAGLSQKVYFSTHFQSTATHFPPPFTSNLPL